MSHWSFLKPRLLQDARMVFSQMDVLHLLTIEVSATTYEDANVLTLGLQAVKAIS